MRRFASTWPARERVAIRVASGLSMIAIGTEAPPAAGVLASYTRRAADPMSDTRGIWLMIEEGP